MIIYKRNEFKELFSVRFMFVLVISLILSGCVAESSPVSLDIKSDLVYNTDIVQRRVRITHYSSEETGSTMTASGVHGVVGVTVACNFLPLGTHVIINGNEYVVHDRGGMDNNTIDIYVNNTNEAINLGTYYANVLILK